MGGRPVHAFQPSLFFSANLPFCHFLLPIPFPLSFSSSTSSNFPFQGHVDHLRKSINENHLPTDKLLAGSFKHGSPLLLTHTLTGSHTLANLPHKNGVLSTYCAIIPQVTPLSPFVRWILCLVVSFFILLIRNIF